MLCKCIREHATYQGHEHSQYFTGACQPPSDRGYCSTTRAHSHTAQRAHGGVYMHWLFHGQPLPSNANFLLSSPSFGSFSIPRYLRSIQRLRVCFSLSQLETNSFVRSSFRNQRTVTRLPFYLHRSALACPTYSSRPVLLCSSLLFHRPSSRVIPCHLIFISCWTIINCVDLSTPSLVSQRLLRLC